MAGFIKDLFACMHLLIYGTVETPITIEDNVPCHWAKTVLSFLEVEGIAVMKCPLQSQDKNPQENVYEIIGEKTQKRNPQNIDDLWVFWRNNGKVSLPPFVRS